MNDRWSRRVPLIGILFAGFLIATFALSWNTPDDKASGAKVISYFHSHRGQEMTANILGVYAVAFWLFFAGALRSYLRRSGASERVTTTAYAGAILFGVGGALLSAVGFALANEINRLDVSGAHTLNLVQMGLFFPAAAGQFVFGIATAVAIRESRALPVWLAWVALLFGVIAITPIGFFGTFLLVLWTLVVSVLVYQRSEALVESGAPAPPGEPVGATLA
jgi:hypothetical protein